jgi:hypothetical protein
MSYDLRMLSDRAAAYWSFSGSTTDFVNGGNLTINNLQYSYPPLISNSASTAAALKILSNTSASWQSITENNQSKIMINDYYSDFTISFWFNFNNQLDGSGYKNTKYNNNTLTLFKITNTSGAVLGKIYYDYLSNTIRFNITGSANSEAYKVLRDFDQTFYVTATYSKGSIHLYLNGVDGNSATVDLNSTLFNTKSNQIYFVLTGESLNNSNFVINSLAFFNYKLSNEQMNLHMIYAGNDGKPFYQSSKSINSFFTLSNNENEMGYTINIRGKEFSRNGQLNGSIINTRNGLEHPYLSNPYLFGSATPVFTTDGVTFSGSAAIRYSDFSNLKVDFTNGLFLNSQIKRTVSSSDYIYSINFNSIYSNYYLYLLYSQISGSWVYQLNLYNALDSTTSSLIYQNTGTSLSSSANIGTQLNSGSIVLYTSDGGTSSVDYDSSSLIYQILSGNYLSYIDIGNFTQQYDSALSNSIKNFGISNDSSISYSASYDFTTPSTIMFRFTSSANPYFVSQYGYWNGIIRSMIIDGPDTYGTQFDWTSMDNCLVSISYDGGSTFSKINRNSTASAYNPYFYGSSNMLLKIELFKEYDYDSSYQSFDNLTYQIQKSNTLYSTGYDYTINQTQSASNNYIISNKTLSILSRINNFGIKFTTNNPSNAILNVPASTSYQGISFWYRPDKIIASASNYILNNVSGSTTAPAIWIDSSSKFVSLGGTLYINGASVSNSTYTASAGEIYYLALSLSASNSSNLYINGLSSITNSTFGFINVWASQPSSSDILLRYKSFFTPQTTTVSDDNKKALFSSSATSENIKTIQIGS